MRMGQSQTQLRLRNCLGRETVDGRRDRENKKGKKDGELWTKKHKQKGVHVCFYFAAHCLSFTVCSLIRSHLFTIYRLPFTIYPLIICLIYLCFIRK